MPVSSFKHFSLSKVMVFLCLATLCNIYEVGIHETWWKGGAQVK